MLNVIVISQVTAHTRRASITRQLEGSALNYHFLDAVDGRDGHGGILRSIDERQFVIETGRNITPGEIGCYASHVTAWRVCSASAQPVVVLEDDVELADSFDDALAICARLIDRCGFIRLQTERRGRSRHVLQVDQRFALRLYTKFPHGAAGYVIGPGVAEDMERSAGVMTAPIDVFIKKFWTHKQLMYGLTPYGVAESDESACSTIGARSKARRTVRQRLHRQAVKLRSFAQRIAESRRQLSAIKDPNVRPVLVDEKSVSISTQSTARLI